MDALFNAKRLPRTAGKSAEAPAIQLALYDDRQGGSDGDPASQLLAFYPSDTPIEQRVGVVGLIRAVAAFAHIFSETSEDVCMDAQQHRWVAITPEPHLGFVLVVDSNWCGKYMRDDTLKALLHHIHDAICLLHGSLQNLVSQESTTEQALTAILEHYGSELESGTPHLLDVHNCLGSEAPVHYFALSRASFTGLQALCDKLMQLPLLHDPATQSRVGAASSTPFGFSPPRAGSSDTFWHEGSSPSGWPEREQLQLLASGRDRGGPHVHEHAVLGCVVMHGSSCLWSSLGRDDTSALVGLASGALLPLRPPHQSPWKKLKDAALATANMSPQPKSPKPAAVPLDRGAWIPAGRGFMQLSGSQRGNGRGPATVQKLHLPLVHIQGDGAGTGHPKRVAQLMPLQQSGSPVLLLLLMHQDYVPAPQALRVIAGAVGAPFQQLCDHMSAEVVAEKGAHVKGFRYVVQDEVLGAIVGSPSSKVATLSRESATLATSVQRQLDERRPSISEDEPQGAHMEVLARAGNSDCWVSGQVAGPRRLLLVMEGRAEKGLLQASATAKRFASDHTFGVS